MNQYGEQQYWNARYIKQPKNFDWLINFRLFQTYLEKYNVDNEAKVLNVGCGNAIICEEMYDYGIHNICNIDISDVVIQQMIQRNKHRNKMGFAVMDAQQLKYQNQYFDIVIDKGTVDALMCSDQYLIIVAKVINQVFRVLKTNGIYFVISYGQPKRRKYLFQRKCVSFSIEVDTIKTQSSIIYVYICRKVVGITQQHLSQWNSIQKQLHQQLQKEKSGFLCFSFGEKKKQQKPKDQIHQVQQLDFQLFGQ